MFSTVLSISFQIGSHLVFRELAFGGMVIGFILKLVLRIAYVTLNPLWTSTGTNTMIFLLAMACVIDRSKVIMSLKEEETDDRNEARLVMPVSTWVAVGCGLGAWFFMAQWLFAEVSVVSRYTGTAFPSLTILPVPGGYVLSSLTIFFILSHKILNEFEVNDFLMNVFDDAEYPVQLILIC